MWPRVDSQHSHCYRCNVVFRDAQLKSGFCAECLVTEKEENTSIAARSNSKLVSKASAKLLSSLREKGKDGQVMPILMNAFFSKLGGTEAVGDIMAEEFLKTLGRGLSPEEAEVYSPNFNLRKDWFDLMARHQSKVDTDKQLDVGSLEESDLESILANIALKAFREDSSLQMAVITQAMSDADLRKQIFYACLRADRSLVNEILQNGGQILDAVAFSEKTPPENIKVEEESYNPHDDEYRDSDA